MNTVWMTRYRSLCTLCGGKGTGVYVYNTDDHRMQKTTYCVLVMLMSW